MGRDCQREQKREYASGNAAQAPLHAPPRPSRLVFLPLIGYVNLFARPAFALAFVGFPIVIRVFR
jgi:hypothetical protein